MAKRRALPLLREPWVTVTIECDTCGDSEVGYMVKELVEHPPVLTCPLCEEPTGQKVILETQ